MLTTIARYDWKDESGIHKNDIKFDKATGCFAMCSGLDAYAQTIEAAVKTVRGELNTRIEYGVPYFTTIFYNRNYAPQWAAEVIRVVKALDFVVSIDAFDYAYDEKSKAMKYSMSVTTTDGSTVEVVED